MSNIHHNKTLCGLICFQLFQLFHSQPWYQFCCIHHFKALQLFNCVSIASIAFNWSAQHFSLNFLKIKMLSAATKVAPESPSGSFGLREKLGKLHVFAVDRTNRWPIQGWSSGDESHYELDEKFVAEETKRPFTLDKETRWPLQGWCQPHKPYNAPSEPVSTKPLAPSRWPQGW